MWQRMAKKGEKICEREGRAGIFKEGLGTEEEESYCTGPPGYIGWRNSFLGIDSGAQYTFKNTGSEYRGRLTEGD